MVWKGKASITRQRCRRFLVVTDPSTRLAAGETRWRAGVALELAWCGCRRGSFSGPAPCTSTKSGQHINTKLVEARLELTTFHFVALCAAFIILIFLATTSDPLRTVHAANYPYHFGPQVYSPQAPHIVRETSLPATRVAMAPRGRRGEASGAQPLRQFGKEGR